MSQYEDKNPKPAQADKTATDERAKLNPAQQDHGKDPNEYDPVGMAGKKAGILRELGDEATDKVKAK